ncbi:MAG TPA: heat-inducible transcriptional repressor HrcA [Candidatus Limnocylindrales bacterium]|nr:heat-inducible transcriptional repressor HrcA [Candidatus Limnocylindrales bacterium]
MARRVRTAGSLDPRSQSILRAVIEEYVDTATPVGSAALVERYGLGVSSATVRNILSDLESAGLLTHPHTSAGRVPTDAGYRYFVESIADSAILPPVEQLMIRHQFGQVQHASEQWFRLAATILAAANRTAAIVTPAKPRTAHVRRIDLVSISERLASLIIVFREGAVRQVLVTLPDATEQQDLTRAAVILDGIMAGRTAADADRALARIDSSGPIGSLVDVVGQRVLAAVRDYDASPIEEVFSDGLLHVMDAPEFDRSEKLRRVFAALENRSYLGGLFDSIAGSGRVQAFIGAENGPDEMRDVSLVLASYGEPSRAVGVVGVLGPTRMAYRQAIGTVRFVSGLMNELVAHIQA